MSDLDWSDPNKTPRQAQQAEARQGRGEPPVNAPSRPLTFAHVGGSIVWQTYPGHLWMTVAQAEAVMADVREELFAICMSGGGVTEAVSMLAEILEAINAARRWRQAQGGA